MGTWHHFLAHIKADIPSTLSRSMLTHASTLDLKTIAPSPLIQPRHSLHTLIHILKMGQILSIRSKRSSPDHRDEEYLAKPSGQCCLKGTIHEGKSRGTWETIAGVETYITKPPAGKANGNVLFYFPDVWGMFPNGLLVMDAFADAGYEVLGLDYFRGVRISATYSVYFAYYFTRIPCGNTERTVRIRLPTPTLITKLGSASTQHLPMKLFPHG